MLSGLAAVRGAPSIGVASPELDPRGAGNRGAVFQHLEGRNLWKGVTSPRPEAVGMITKGDSITLPVDLIRMASSPAIGTRVSLAAMSLDLLDAILNRTVQTS